MTSLEETTGKILERLKANPESTRGLEQQSNARTCKICETVLSEQPVHKRFGDKGLCDKEECRTEAKLRHIRENLQSYMYGVGIPTKFHTAVSDRNIAPYSKSRRGVYLHGKIGRGKTVMACSIARNILLTGDCGQRENNYSMAYIHFYSSPKLIMQLQDCFKKENESAFDMLERIAQEEIIIIDDLGAEKLTDFVRQSLYFLINEREQWERKTIITSNYSLDELDKHIDGRISSRIAGMCDIVEVSGKDRRLK